MLEYGNQSIIFSERIFHEASHLDHKSSMYIIKYIYTSSVRGMHFIHIGIGVVVSIPIAAMQPSVKSRLSTNNTGLIWSALP